MRQALEKLATHMAEQSKRTDVSWGHIASSIEDSTRNLTVGWGGLLTRLTGSQPVITRIASTMSQGFRGSKENIEAMVKKFDEMRGQLGAMRDPSRDLNHQSRAWNSLLRQTQFADREIAAHTKLSQTISQTMTGTTGAALVALLGSMKVTLDYSKQINEALIQGNSSVAARTKLIKDISVTQAETGNEMQDMTKAAAALTNYGFDLRGSFKDTLKTVVLMEEGLGVSYESSAQLAVTVNRIGGDFKRVSDSVARVKTDTALAAEEAVKFAQQIGKAVMMLKPGSGSLVDQTSEYINRLAGALKELTGSGQDIVTMLSSFTTEAGMMGAATVGATPDFLASPDQTKKVTENFVKYVNQQLSGTSGFQRMATIQLLAEQFNTTADLIVNADKMLAKYNETQKNTTSLQEQWRQQTSEIGKTLSKVYESMKSIVQQALIPSLQILRPALSVLADTVGYLAKQSWIVYGAGVVLVSSAVLATVAFTRLAFAIGQAALASSVMKESLGTGAGGIGNIFTKRGARDLAKWLRTDLMTGKAVPLSRAKMTTRFGSNIVTTWLPRIGTVLTRIGAFVAGPLAAVAAAGLAGAAAGLAADKYVLKRLGIDIAQEWVAVMGKKDAFRTATANITSGGMTRDDILKNVSAMAASGRTAEEIQKFLLKNASNVRGIKGGALTPERRKKIIDGILEDAGREITRQGIRVGHTSLTEQSDADHANQQKFIDLLQAVSMNTAFANELVKRTEDKRSLENQALRSMQDDYNAEQQASRRSLEGALEVSARKLHLW